MTSPIDDAVAVLDERANWSVYIADADSREPLAGREPARPLRAASLGKIVLLLAASAAIDDDPELEHEQLSRDSVARVADSGLWQHLAQPTLTFGDVAALVGAVSDNLATNVLITRLGLGEVAAFTARAQIGQLELHDLVRDERGPRDAPNLSTASAGALCGVFMDLHARSIISEAADERILRWLAPSVDHSMVIGAFDLDPLAHQDGPVQIWHKTGTDVGVRGDAGLIHVADRTVAYAAIANWLTRDMPNGRVLAGLRSIGQAIRTELAAEPASRPTVGS